MQALLYLASAASCWPALPSMAPELAIFVLHIVCEPDPLQWWPRVSMTGATFMAAEVTGAANLHDVFLSYAHRLLLL